ncbi:hypothetical protein JTB14_017907 [Gonioctena quinquepunctata]|nr:hypothetical protein JTB14_017907 [Gonioctena quinquepunctata]
MVESVTLLSLPRMCDLALNTPEVGVVNFTVLHSLLQVMINQLGLTDTNVEFRGPDSDRIQHFLSGSSPSAPLTLTQYSVGSSSVDEEGKDKPKKVSARLKSEKGAKDETVKEKPVKSRKRSANRGSTGKESDDEKREPGTESQVVLVQTSKSQLSGDSQYIAVTKERYEELQDRLGELEDRLAELEGLPADEKIMNALASDSSEKTPVLDMYQILSLRKRMDAVDESIEKLASMMETVARESLENFERKESVAPPYKTLRTRIESLEKTLVELGHMSTSFTMSADFPEEDEAPPTDDAEETGEEVKKIAPKHVSHAAIEALKKAIFDMKERLCDIPQLVQDVAAIQKMLSSSPDTQPADLRIRLLETKFEDFQEQIHSLDGGFSRQVNVTQNRVSDMEKQLGEVLERIHLTSDEYGMRDNGQMSSEIHGQLVILQDDFANVAETVNKLTEEYSGKQHAFDVLVEQIELLKTVKADREDLEDALADKADACQINRKVSFEQFDQACGDMSKSLEEALAKLTQQETLWTQALDNIQNSIGGKLDKSEMNPLRDFINIKLKSLQEKFKNLSALKREHEAAGTKSKYLRNVNCISCDKDVVMRTEMDPTLFPKPYAVPPSRSMGPYLAYELDQLRKQQKCLPNSKNINTLENAVKNSRSARSPDHICNRYCGGSHTVTTPQQRVTRLGHFLEQWGPEIAPVDDTHVRGTDGRLYKSRDDAQLRQLANERPPTPHPDNKPVIYITPDNTARRSLKETSTPQVQVPERKAPVTPKASIVGVRSGSFVKVPTESTSK